MRKYVTQNSNMSSLKSYLAPWWTGQGEFLMRLACVTFAHCLPMPCRAYTVCTPRSFSRSFPTGGTALSSRCCHARCHSNRFCWCPRSRLSGFSLESVLDKTRHSRGDGSIWRRLFIGTVWVLRYGRALGSDNRPRDFPR